MQYKELFFLKKNNFGVHKIGCGVVEKEKVRKG